MKSKEEFEFELFDRIAKIQATNKQLNLEEKSYIAFSGGKDSCVLSKIIDLALPDNSIPRVYANTGIEYNDMVKFVKSLAQNDSRVVVMNQVRNIKKTLETYGYPFKSKEHSQRLYAYMTSGYLKEVVAYLDESRKSFICPTKLRYQFYDKTKLNFLVSKKCCDKLKKDLMHTFERNNDKNVVITGIRAAEGGLRATKGHCISGNGKQTRFNPLLPLSDEFCEWFIQEYNISLCKLYYPPYNFTRTGCKGCPFNLHLQKDLELMKELLPNEYKQCEILWKPVYEEYRRIGYRLLPTQEDKDRDKEMSLFGEY